MDFVKVSKGILKTKINSKQLQHYINNGWEEVIEEASPRLDTYDKYTKAQLLAIGENRKITFKENQTKNDIKDRLLKEDKIVSIVSVQPSNKGYTDNLIIE